MLRCDHETDLLCTVHALAGHAECREGHDHLIGMPHTGDFNVAGDVILVAFTPQGFSDGAIRPAS